MINGFSPAQFQLLLEADSRLRDTAHYGKAAVVKYYAEEMGCSTKTLYRHLNQLRSTKAAAHAERKRRTDRGKCKLPTDDLRRLAAALHESTSGTGVRMPLDKMVRMLAANGTIGPVFQEADRTTIAKALRRHGLSAEDLGMPSVAKRLTSLHPNHVYQMDSTTGALYHSDKLGLRMVDPADVNKNKLGNAIKVMPALLTLWLIVDHTSGAFKLRFQEGGEGAERAIQFLVYAIEKQPRGPMHGVPKILMTDQGPAYKGEAFKGFCSRLDIKHLRHKPRNARATGAAEKGHDLVQRFFERRLRFVDSKSLSIEALNALAEAWADEFCATEVHSRTGKPRYSVWMEIRPEQLRMPADPQLLRDLALGKRATARVDDYGDITFRSRTYHVADIPGVNIRRRVSVQPNIYRFPQLDVLGTDPDSGDERWYAVQPLELDGYGFDGKHVIGQGYRSLPDTQADRQRKDTLREAYSSGAEGAIGLGDAERASRRRAPIFGGAVDPFADISPDQLPVYLPRRGTELQAVRPAVVLPPLNVVVACERLMIILGANYRPEVYAHVAAVYSDGVPETELPVIAALFASPMAAAADNVTVLRQVNGGQVTGPAGRGAILADGAVGPATCHDGRAHEGSGTKLGQRVAMRTPDGAAEAAPTVLRAVEPAVDIATAGQRLARMIGVATLPPYVERFLADTYGDAPVAAADIKDMAVSLRVLRDEALAEPAPDAVSAWDVACDALGSQHFHGAPLDFAKAALPHGVAWWSTTAAKVALARMFRLGALGSSVRTAGTRLVSGDGR